MGQFTRCRVGNTEKVFDATGHFRFDMSFQLGHIDDRRSLQIETSHPGRGQNGTARQGNFDKAFVNKGAELHSLPFQLVHAGTPEKNLPLILEDISRAVTDREILNSLAIQSVSKGGKYGRVSRHAILRSSRS
jgi:hypothetical protein